MLTPTILNIKSLKMKSFFFKIVILFSLLSINSCNKQVEITYYPNGQIKEKYQLRKGKHNGECIFYYEDGTLEAKGYFRNGKMDGEWIYYYPDGKTMTLQTIRNGNTIRFDSWDQIGQKVIDKGTGTLIIYYPNGSIKSTTSYKKGHLDGTIQSWYPNGLLESEQFFDEGKPKGTWHMWNEEGIVIYEEEFDD